MKRSDGVTGVMPTGVVTRTSTVPLPDGAVAVIELFELTVKVVAAVPPNDTPVARPKFVPVMVTKVPPAAMPDPGNTLVTVGTAAT